MLIIIREDMFDTTLRPICFGLKYNEITPDIAKKVGAETFKKYEYILYVCAQLSRIVYCDSGIIRYVIMESFGLNNDDVNKCVKKYDWKYLSERRKYANIESPENGRPMKSYIINSSDGTNNPFAIYISGPSDCTAIVVKATSLKPNTNSIFLPEDIFISFKGSSTLDNFKHDLFSQFSPSELKSLVKGIIPNNVGNVPSSFIKPIMEIFGNLIDALETFIQKDCRLFLTGHSLGGAFTSLFAFILAEMKEGNRLSDKLSKIKSIHVVSFGSPTILSDEARNNFNKHLESGLITLDRVVSQSVAARSTTTALVTSLGTGIGGPNDIIPNVPIAFSHPGFRPLLSEFRPEANGRPYQMMNIRTFYGVSSKTNGRESTTWPFPTFTPDAPKEAEEKPPTELSSIVIEETSQSPQEGGSFGKFKAEYAKQTKNHLPNFVSVLGSKWAFAFAHAEYLGMFFTGGFRGPGMKNPASKRIAYFIIDDNGVDAKYNDILLSSTPQPVATKPAAQSAAQPAPTPTQLGGGRRYRKKKNTNTNKKKKKKLCKSHKNPRRYKSI